MDLLAKYPRTKKAMNEMDMSLEELYVWTEIELKRLQKIKKN